MGKILPATMENNPRWKLAVPPAFWADVPKSERYALCPDGNIVAPWTARADEIGRSDSRIIKKAAQNNLCSACGKHLDTDDVVVFFKGQLEIDALYRHCSEEGPHQTEPPLHLACAGYTARACPHIRSEKWDAIIATAWKYVVECKEDGRPEFWPDTEMPLEILNYDAFLERTHPV